MSIQFLFLIVVMFGAMFLMTRSAKNKQRQASDMRNKMEPGTGVRTIGGMYAIVKEVHDDTVLLELADGVHAHFAKNAIGAVLDEAEYDRVVHGIDPAEDETDTDADTDADTDTDTDTDAGAVESDDETVAAGTDAEDRIDLSKSADAGDEQPKDGPKTDGTDTK